MNLFLYNLFIRLYGLVTKLIAPFHDKAHYFVHGRKNLFRKIENEVVKNAPLVWFHCASLGEFEQGRPIIEALKDEFPEIKILLSFFSPSGYEIRKNYAHADYVYYLPLDTEKNAKKWVEIIKPKAVFIIKYEYWHHYIKAVHAENIPIFSVSSIFRERQFFFKKYGEFGRDILKRFTHLFVQDKESKVLLTGIGIDNVSVSGDTRFDRVHTIRQQTTPIPIVEKFKNGNQIFVIGSSWPEDMEILSAFINQCETNMKFIIAPHEVYEMSIKRIESQIDKPVLRYSDATPENAGEFNVMVIDNVGMLSSLYQYGDFAYVGGGFGKGLHNILEPATFGLPVFFGNRNFKKFREARELTQLGGAFSIADFHELKQKFQNINHDVAATTAQSYVEGNTGATQTIINHCKSYLAS